MGIKDLTNQKFGMLKAITPLECREPSNHCVFWLCECECGSKHIVNSNNLIFGRVKSCGCLKRRKRR